VSGEADHLIRSNEAFAAARLLRGAHPSWAVVPLFYSAMHLMHARFDLDQLSADQRHPGQHKSYRDPSTGQVAKWGTLDVVRTVYPRHISSAYSSLFSASTAARYSAPIKGDGARLWAEHQVISDFVVPPTSS
jgi:hypothetical protein